MPPRVRHRGRGTYQNEVEDAGTTLMTNGDIDKAQLEALKSAPPDEKLDYVVTCAFYTKRAVDLIPDQIATAIKAQRRKDRRFLGAMAAAIAAVISLATPFLLHVL